jgi:N-acetylmuramoyl-L-alanine amidase
VEVPTWVKNDYYHRVTQTLYKGKPVIKGGKECVLLGKKVKKSGGQEIAGINTWVAKENLVIVNSIPDNKGNRTIQAKRRYLMENSGKRTRQRTRYPEIKKLNGLLQILFTPDKF